MIIFALRLSGIHIFYPLIILACPISRSVAVCLCARSHPMSSAYPPAPNKELYDVVAATAVVSRADESLSNIIIK